MRKFLAVVKHEYKKVVLRWSFLIGTLLMPFLAVCFAVVPALIFSLKGEPTRLAVVDPTGRIAQRLRDNLASGGSTAANESGGVPQFSGIEGPNQNTISEGSKKLPAAFEVTEVPYDRNRGAQIREELAQKVVSKEIDAFLIVPDNVDAPNAVFEFRSRRGGDFMAIERLKDALNRAVRSQRLADANIDEKTLNELSADINFDVKGVNETGAEKDSSGLMAASFIIGLMIYITLTIYGQAIMGAVVEEKETRIAEILFSSARPFTLMMGKLVGVGLAGLTQLAIWIITAVLVLGVALSQAGGIPVDAVPTITPLMVFYFLVFFLIGFFIYASVFALIGSMVTTVQEGGQFAFPPIMILLIGFYLSFAVIRDPSSTISFWVSIAPFFAPITMPVRILAETPPVWQIALSLVLNGLAIAGLVWLTSRVYRIGMLMYGKRATIPEVWKWIRQA